MAKFITQSPQLGDDTFLTFPKNLIDLSGVYMVDLEANLISVIKTEDDVLKNKMSYPVRLMAKLVTLPREKAKDFDKIIVTLALFRKYVFGKSIEMQQAFIDTRNFFRDQYYKVNRKERYKKRTAVTELYINDVLRAEFDARLDWWSCNHE